MKRISRLLRVCSFRLPDIRLQIISNWRLIAFPAMLWMAMLAAVVILALHAQIPVAALTQDTAAYLGGQPYIGAFSAVGTHLWAASAAACGLTAWIVNNSPRHHHYYRFFFVFSGLSLLLGADDMFQMHETLAEALSISDGYIVAGYALTIVSCLVFLLQRIMRGRYVLLFLSLIALGASSLLDVSMDILMAYRGGEVARQVAAGMSGVGAHSLAEAELLVEDGLKLLGIMLWATFLFSTCADTLSVAMAESI